MDTNLADKMEKYRNRTLRLLPVIIQNVGENTKQAFFIAMKNALSMNGLEDILPDTYYEQILACITIWKDQYHSTYTQFKELL